MSGLDPILMPLAQQVNLTVSENQSLRVKSDNDEITIQLLKEQYDSLSASFSEMKSKYELDLHEMRTERDKAIVAKTEMDRLLRQAGDLLLQAARASSGDDTHADAPQEPRMSPVALLQ